jgi:hypothetical protein
MLSLPELDRGVRLHVYEGFLAEGKPPTAEETAQDLSLSVGEAEESYRRLAEGRVIVLAPGTTNIWMANPLSAYPTPFWVETPRGAYFGSCIWDAFGVVAMLGGTGTISTHCPDCGEGMELRVADGELQAADGIAHFAVPARRWWENIGYA